MAEHRLQFRSYDPDPNGFDDPADIQLAPYKFGRTARYDGAQDGTVPLFLSDPDSQPEPAEFVAPLRKRRLASLSSKILMAVVAAAGVAMLFAWSSSDATRSVILDAKASMAAMVTPSAQADAAQLTPGDLLIKDPARVGAPAPQPTAPAAASAPAATNAPAASTAAPIVVASATPSREEITNAYQSALRGAAAPAAAAPAAALPAPVVPAPQPSPAQAHHMDNDELATLMKRAKEMLGMGDVPAARLLLERAAEGGDAGAALMLARTYDPAVLGNSDVRNIVPEPDKARVWYQRAAQYGSAEAERRLAQLPN